MYIWAINEPIEMKLILNRENAYTFSDEELLEEIFNRIRRLRLSSCMSQEEYAEAANVSRTTIKRIESGTSTDISLRTLIKILRAGGMMDGLGDLVEEAPLHPALKNNTGKRPYASSKLRRKYETQ